MRAAALLVVLIAAIAGCAAAPDASGPAPAPGDGSATDGSAAAILEPCTEHAADAPVDAAEAQRHLPQGLAPRRLPAGGPALLEVVAVECDLAGVAARAVFVWMLVEPPAGWESAEVGAFSYIFAAVTDDEALAAQLRAAGVPATIGSVAWETTETPLTISGASTASTDAWSVGVETLVPKREQQRVHAIVRGFVGDETGITHAVDIDGGSHPHNDPGQGTIRVEGDAPFPTPQAPGVAVYGIAGHLGFHPVALEATSTSS